MLYAAHAHPTRVTPDRMSVAHLTPLLSSAEGQYAPHPGMYACLKCTSELGEYYDSSEGSATCDRCKSETYMTEGICKPKPKGVVVDEPGTVSFESSMCVCERVCPLCARAQVRVCARAPVCVPD